MKSHRQLLPAWLLSAAVALTLGHAGPAVQAGEEEEIQEITLKPDATGMKFDITEFTVTAGKKVKLTFDNTSPVPLPHNVLILKPGTLQKVGMLANAMLTDPQALAKEYIPESDDILFHTSLIQPTEKEVLEFTAPEEPGEYPYTCTFPGHWMVMQGVMTVEAAE